MAINDFTPHLDAFDGITPFAGPVEKGFLVNFLGAKLDAGFRTMWGIDPEAVGGCHMETTLPAVGMGEGWFEDFNWVAAAREARDSYVMMTLGACYGAQAVGSYLALQALNPMPATLVAVDGVPENIAWTRKHFLDNGIDPDGHWIVEAAMSDSNEPVIFPVGSPGSGAQNCVSTNSAGFRRQIGEAVIQAGRTDEVLRNLLQSNSTGIQINLTPDTEYEFEAELRLVSAVTLGDLLGPFRRVDYIEADIQQSEEIVFPPAMAALTRKVRRVHLGTHGLDAHRQMHALFATHGWEILFSFEPNGSYETPFGTFELNDGVLTAVNPAVAYSDA
ncbi:MAG: hypothetical protein QF893_02070 [Alphaproteobacteria bacterium]|nr:hypothetical protein [Alphaproteobacteria bacterium]